MRVREKERDSQDKIYGLTFTLHSSNLPLVAKYHRLVECVARVEIQVCVVTFKKRSQLPNEKELCRVSERTAVRSCTLSALGDGRSKAKEGHNGKKRKKDSL